MSMALAPSAKANQFFPSANICTMDMYSRKRKNHNQPCAEPSCRTKICQTSLWSKEAQAIDIAKLLHDSLQVHCQAKIEWDTRMKCHNPGKKKVDEISQITLHLHLPPTKGRCKIQRWADHYFGPLVRWSPAQRTTEMLSDQWTGKNSGPVPADYRNWASASPLLNYLREVILPLKGPLTWEGMLKPVANSGASPFKKHLLNYTTFCPINLAGQSF